MLLQNIIKVLKEKFEKRLLSTKKQFIKDFGAFNYYKLIEDIWEAKTIEDFEEINCYFEEFRICTVDVNSIIENINEIKEQLHFIENDNKEYGNDLGLHEKLIEELKEGFLDWVKSWKVGLINYTSEKDYFNLIKLIDDAAEIEDFEFLNKILNDEYDCDSVNIDGIVGNFALYNDLPTNRQDLLKKINELEDLELYHTELERQQENEWIEELKLLAEEELEDEKLKAEVYCYYGTGQEIEYNYSDSE